MEWGRTHKEHRGGGKGTPAQPLSAGGRRAELARARVKGNLRCDKSFSCMFLAGHKIEEHLIYSILLNQNHGVMKEDLSVFQKFFAFVSVFRMVTLQQQKLAESCVLLNYQAQTLLR